MLPLSVGILLKLLSRSTLLSSHRSFGLRERPRIKQQTRKHEEYSKQVRTVSGEKHPEIGESDIAEENDVVVGRDRVTLRTHDEKTESPQTL